MKALQIHLNGEKLIAGIEDGTITFVITIKKTNNTELIELNVTGLDNKKSDDTQLAYQYWAKNELKENDKISIQVIETKKITPPRKSETILKSVIQNQFKED